MAKVKPGGITTRFSNSRKTGGGTQTYANTKTVSQIQAENKALIKQLKTAKGEQRKGIQKMINANRKLIKMGMKKDYRSTRREQRANKAINTAKETTKRVGYGYAAEGATATVGGATAAGVKAIDSQNNLVDVAQKSVVSSGRDEEEASETKENGYEDIINSLGGRYD